MRPSEYQADGWLPWPSSLIASTTTLWAWFSRFCCLSGVVSIADRR